MVLSTCSRVWRLLLYSASQRSAHSQYISVSGRCSIRLLTEQILKWLRLPLGNLRCFTGSGRMPRIFHELIVFRLTPYIFCSSLLFTTDHGARVANGSHSP